MLLFDFIFLITFALVTVSPQLSLKIFPFKAASKFFRNIKFKPNNK
jgi:hypothetical protein